MSINLLKLIPGLLLVLAASASAQNLPESLFPPAPDKLNACRYFWDPTSQRYMNMGYFAKSFNLEKYTLPILPYYTRFAQALEKVDIKLVVVPVAPDYTVYSSMWGDKERTLFLKGFSPEEYAASYKAFADSLNSKGIKTVNVLDLAKSYERSGKHFYFKFDRHWNSDGAEATAYEIARVIKTSFPGIVAALPKSDFTVINLTPISVNGGILSDYLNTCGVKSGSADAVKASNQEQTRRTKMEPVGGAGSSLLDEPSFPIVLTGTSQSRLSGTSAVANPLSQALNANVLDASVVAGGPFGSIISYFVSDDYLRERPKVLIWESEANGEAPSNPAEFRQLIPSVYGTCQSRAQVASNTLKLNGTKDAQILLKVPPSMMVSGHKNYVNFKFSDVSLVEFDVIFQYAGGKADTVKIKRTTRIPNNGQFYLELADSLTEKLAEVILVPSMNSTSSVSATLCEAPL